jgi:hypothetical protein
MEQELRLKINELMPKIKEANSSFNEQELVVIKAAFMEITGINWVNMMSCGGKLCEDIKRSILNWNNLQEVISENVIKVQPVKTKTRLELLEECNIIAEAKGIKKPHPAAGIDKLNQYIRNNGN